MSHQHCKKLHKLIEKHVPKSKIKLIATQTKRKPYKKMIKQAGQPG